MGSIPQTYRVEPPIDIIKRFSGRRIKRDLVERKKNAEYS